ncbi:MAG TPA: hypothetical protein ENH62_06090 [Marinobacter sp.]|uniref:Uncharacterized protein n=1 Tax=marine sediment metagenome TaxID=412755 RepID=A0A0F9SKY0_9ZZZZ|nr:hypothetical protein [Marinobacter sp.]HEC61421.1 hypothetical protein [bacterium]
MFTVYTVGSYIEMGTFSDEQAAINFILDDKSQYVWFCIAHIDNNRTIITTIVHAGDVYRLEKVAQS